MLLIYDLIFKTISKSNTTSDYIQFIDYQENNIFLILFLLQRQYLSCIIYVHIHNNYLKFFLRNIPIAII